MSWHCTCMALASLAWHLVGLLHGYGKCRTVAVWQEKENPQRQKTTKKRPLCVPLLSLLARHDNTVSPSFFFLDPSRKGTCFIINSEREVRPPLKVLSFYGDVEGWVEESRVEETQRRKFWWDLIQCLEADVLGEAGVCLWSWIKYVL